MKKILFTGALILAPLGALLLAGCGGGGSSSMISITLTTGNGKLSVDESEPNAMPPFFPTLSFIAAVGGDTKNQGVTWELDKQSGCSGTGTGSGQCGTLTNSGPFAVTYTPPSNLTATVSVTLTAKSIADTKTTQTATISVVVPPTFSTTICNPPGVLPCVLASGQNGVPYTQAISITGGVAPYTWAATSNGSPGLPDCLALTSSTSSTSASVSGKPCNTTAQTASFTVNVTDTGGAPLISQAFSITLAAAPPLSVTTTSLPSGFLDIPYTAKVATQGGVPPLTWDFKPTPAGSLPAGDIVGLPPGLSASAANGQITGIATDQSNAPIPVTYPATYSFTVQVEDSSLPAPGQKQPATPLLLSITIQKPQPLSITTQPPLPTGQTASGYNASLRATGGVQPYTWSLIQGQLPAGLTLSTANDGTGSISGIPVLVNTSTFTVKVADSEVDPATGNPKPMTAQQAFTINVAAGANNNTLLKGPYVFLFRGFDDDGTVAISGTIVADGAGNITTGLEDSNRVSSVALGATVTAGNYTIDSTGDGRGKMELTVAFAGRTPLINDYDLVLDGNGNARFFQQNSTNPDPKHTHGEGILRPLVGSSFANTSFSGNYAFEFSGYDLAGKPAALAGVITANGTDQSLTPGTGDFNDAGTFDGGPSPTSQPFNLSGDFTVLGSNRGTMAITFAPSASSPQVTLNFVFAFISSSDLIFIESDSSTTTTKPTNFQLAGEMILQQPTIRFNQNALPGVSVATGTGINSNGNASVFAGLMTAPVCDGQTALTLTSDENSGGTLATPSFSGTCTITSNGRVNFALTGNGNPAPSLRIAAAYLTGPGQGFLLGGDAEVSSGQLEHQSAGPFAEPSVLDGYTLSTLFVGEARVKNVLGQVTADGNGNLGGVVDEIDPPGSSPTLDQSLATTFTSPAPAGRGTLATTAPVPAGFPASSVFYIVSPGSIRLISTDTTDQHPELILLDH
ncbi:MAG TPA: putative Ig domain-containing protein [Candidatus Acidoferrales bacterium]|nr:putative Ig domain-containing protein [Candidatus Acidoferrales bacterium]